MAAAPICGGNHPRLGDPAASDQGGRGLRVVDAIAARWDGFRIGQAQVVWCDIGKPLDGALGDTWASLARLLAEVPLAAADTHLPRSRPGQPCRSLR